METELLQSLGKIAGIGGIALGVFFLIVKYVLAMVQPTRLPSAQTSALLNRTLLAAWSIAVLGVSAWFIGNMVANQPAPLAAEGGVATGRDIKGSEITIDNAQPKAPERSSRRPADNEGVSSQGGVAAGRDISGSKIDIGGPSGQ